MAKILVTENIHEVGPELLRAAGHTVVFANRELDVIKREIVDADAIIVRIYELPGELLQLGKQLKHISKHGVGYDNIDLDYCKAHNIVVTIAPGANSLSVAEHAFAMMNALAKNLKLVSQAYQNIGFAAKNSKEGMELTGKTVGIIGFGRIGSRFAKLCHGAYDMKVLAYDPYVDTYPDYVTRVTNLDDLFTQADVISMHPTLNPETRNMVDASRLAQMKPRALIINCARGPMVDNDALIEALQKGTIAGAGLDVTVPEPLKTDSPLFTLPNAIVTPHYAPTTLESAMRTSQVASENAIAVLSGKEPVGRIV